MSLGLVWLFSEMLQIKQRTLTTRYETGRSGYKLEILLVLPEEMTSLRMTVSRQRGESSASKHSRQQSTANPFQNKHQNLKYLIVLNIHRITYVHKPFNTLTKDKK